MMRVVGSSRSLYTEQEPLSSIAALRTSIQNGESDRVVDMLATNQISLKELSESDKKGVLLALLNSDKPQTTDLYKTTITKISRHAFTVDEQAAHLTCEPFIPSAAKARWKKVEVFLYQECAVGATHATLSTLRDNLKTLGLQIPDRLYHLMGENPPPPQKEALPPSQSCILV